MSERTFDTQSKVDEVWALKTENTKLREHCRKLEAEVAGLNESLDKYRNGYQGSCWCCEPVGMRNVELNTALERAREQMIDQAERAGKAEAAIARVDAAIEKWLENYGTNSAILEFCGDLRAALKEQP